MILTATAKVPTTQHGSKPELFEVPTCFHKSKAPGSRPKIPDVVEEKRSLSHNDSGGRFVFFGVLVLWVGDCEGSSTWNGHTLTISPVYSIVCK